jgi:DNA-binding NtrC family response regulator
MQAKLLRVLADGEIRPLGGERVRKVDVRVIAATHRDLAELVRRGQFREDLYYRLAVMVIPIPPLRERREDIPVLVAHFVEKHARRAVTVDRRAMARLVENPWPGNVRQLENEVMRASVFADGTIREDDLTPAHGAGTGATANVNPAAPPPKEGRLKAAVNAVERQLVERALREHSGNQSRAASWLGLSRFGLQKKLKRLRLGPHQTDALAVRDAADAEADADADADDADDADDGARDEPARTRSATYARAARAQR